MVLPSKTQIVMPCGCSVARSLGRSLARSHDRSRGQLSQPGQADRPGQLCKQFSIAIIFAQTLPGTAQPARLIRSGRQARPAVQEILHCYDFCVIASRASSASQAIRAKKLHCNYFCMTAPGASSANQVSQAGQASCAKSFALQLFLRDRSPGQLSQPG